MVKKITSSAKPTKQVPVTGVSPETQNLPQLPQEQLEMPTPVFQSVEQMQSLETSFQIPEKTEMSQAPCLVPYQIPEQLEIPQAPCSMPEQMEMSQMTNVVDYINNATMNPCMPQLSCEECSKVMGTQTTATCIPQEKCIDNVMLVQAYVPFQFHCTTYSPVQSLKKGTTFPELYKPYHSKKYHKNCH